MAWGEGGACRTTRERTASVYFFTLLRSLRCMVSRVRRQLISSLTDKKAVSLEERQGTKIAGYLFFFNYQILLAVQRHPVLSRELSFWETISNTRSKIKFCTAVACQNLNCNFSCTFHSQPAQLCFPSIQIMSNLLLIPHSKYLK